MRLSVKHKMLLITALLAVIAVIIFTNYYSYKDRIFRIVVSNVDLLNNSVKSESYDKAYQINGIKQINDYSSIIEFYCFGRGLVPSSVYYGFYYSKDGKPHGFEGTDAKLSKEEIGWTWSEENGDNSYYTEHIIDNWYYYKAGF